MSFGTMLQKLRAQHDLSQRALAELVGIDFTYISKIENEALDPPSEETLIKMANVFGVDRYDFILSAKKIPTDFEFAIRTNEDIVKALKEAVKNYPKP